MTVWSLMRYWDLVLPPSRPSRRELEHIAQMARDVSRTGRVAVLGSTPEFRDWLHELGFGSVFVLERDLNFLTSIAGLRVHRNRETIVHGDWLETLGRYKNEFSLILSDLTMGNVEYERREEFYELVAGALTDDGLFYDKVLTHPESGLDVGRLIDKYRRLPLNLLHVNHFSCEMIFCSEIITRAGLVDTTRVYDAVERLDGGPRIAAFSEAAQRITPRGLRWYYGRPWKVVEPTYCRELVRISVADDEVGSPYYGLLKLFVMGRPGRSRGN